MVPQEGYRFWIEKPFLLLSMISWKVGNPLTTVILVTVAVLAILKCNATLTNAIFIQPLRNAFFNRFLRQCLALMPLLTALFLAALLAVIVLIRPLPLLV